MIIIIKHEKLSDGSNVPAFSIIGSGAYIKLHTVDDEKCTEVTKALYDCTVDIDKIIDYRWMDEKT